MSKRTIRPAVRQIPDEFVECRALKGHAWRFTTVDEYKQTFVQHLQCSRCDATKWWEIDNVTGAILHRSSPSYRPGYLLKGQGRITPVEQGSLVLRALRAS